jgi:hypothetical protein
MRRISQQQLLQRRRKQFAYVARCATLRQVEASDSRLAVYAAVAFALLVILTTSGCNPFAMYQTRHTGLDFHGQRDIAYYYYPGASWFVPAQQKHHCPVVIEPQFHGFAATCWTHWPEPWQPCPPPGYCGPMPHGPEGYYLPPEEIGTPPGEPQPRPALESPSGARVPQSPVRGPHRADTPARIAALPPSPKRAVTGPAASPRTSAVKAEPIVASRPNVTHHEFVGKHGFSSPEEGASAAAVIVDLTPGAGTKIGGFSD